MTTSSSSLIQHLTRSGQYSDPWGRYYTSAEVSRSLIERIKAREPKLVLELGSGSGSLCSAAASRWRDAQLVTVDVDHQAPKQLAAEDSKHIHFVHDALDEALSDKIGLCPGTVDVAVCNPPYIRPRWRSDFGKILEDAGLSGTLASIRDAGADLLFLAQNLRLLRRNGKLGLILPDGLITAERFSGVRQALVRQHNVEQVVQLPRGVFKNTEAQTYLAVLSKMAGETEHVILRQMGHDGRLSEAIEVPQDLAAKRLDYTFHARPNFQTHSGALQPISVGTAATHVVRGTICSSAIATFPAPVFHLSDFAESTVEQTVRVVPKRFALGRRSATIASQDARLALPGDILLARIGRRLERQLAIVVHGPCVISDCVFALRTTDEHRERLYRFFDSEAGRLALATSAHGVAARFLSKTNLVEIQF
ncbi:SAM-dependent methyltransferase [Burkholderia sp. AU31624]|uniref:HsdM family class I SAM-dependent methyltransferase n=1 Tax=unclassified Burkholderia TaxID=2613784 RepID=UPI0015C5BC51|nr:MULTISPECIES: N-6 DNA methylase [unclassified Burkholderia]MCA8256421.1 SAM-dependent methyltransferase [Burkholderia sp. AU31624]